MNNFEIQFLFSESYPRAETNDMNSKSWLLAIAAMNFSYGEELLAGSDIVLDRYTNQSPVPLSEQSDLLSVVVQVEFPSSISTTADAIRYLLQQSGFTLASDNRPEVLKMGQMQLPRVHRRIGPIKLRTALETIAGQPWAVIEDPITRSITFELKPQYAETLAKAQRNSNASQMHSIERDSVTDHSHRAERKDWEMDPSLTLYENFDIWTKREGWQLDWKSRHDYEISYHTTFSGTLKEVVAQALSFYSTAPVPLIAKFYDGNFVVVIETAQPRN